MTWEDQQRICAFSRVTAPSHELDAEISAKTRAIGDLDEASTELAFADEEESRGAQLGGVFRRRRRGGGGEEGGGDVDARAGGLERLKEERKVLREDSPELKM